MGYFLAKAAKSARAGLALALLGVITAAAAGAVTYYAVRTIRARPFAVHASPKTVTIAPGFTARYALAVKRSSPIGYVSLRLSAPPQRSIVRVRRLNRSGTKLLLTITTDPLTPTGSYRLRLRGSAGQTGRAAVFHAAASLLLVIKAPRSAPLQIAGNLTGLEPGVWEPLNLRLTNPGNAPVKVTALRVTLGSLSALRATLANGCGGQDFGVRQFSGRLPLPLPAHSMRTLTDLGIRADQLPQAALLDRPVDQDGCQGASIVLNYTGTASRR